MQFFHSGRQPAGMHSCLSYVMAACSSLKPPPLPLLPPFSLQTSLFLFVSPSPRLVHVLVCDSIIWVSLSPADDDSVCSRWYKHTLIWKCCSVIVSVWASRPTNPWWWFSIKVGSVGEAGQKALEKKHLWFPNGISSIIRQTSECNQRRRSCYVWFSTSQQHNPTLISKLRRCPKTTTTRATVKAIYMFIALDGWQEEAKKKKTF